MSQQWASLLPELPERVSVELVGDLERAFASATYPNRVVVALVGTAALVALGLIARSRRWDLAARRQPRRTAGAVVIGLAILGPLGWYLGSPLIVSTTVDEPAPVVADNASPGPTTAATIHSSASPATATKAPTASAVPTPALLARSGPFAGADEFHFGRGTARLIESEPNSFIVRLEDFAVRNGPDLYIYLSPSSDGYVEGAIEVGRLKADRGNQNYDVPEGTDVEAVASVVIWCKQFSVLFAVAPL